MLNNGSIFSLAKFLPFKRPPHGATHQKTSFQHCVGGEGASTSPWFCLLLNTCEKSADNSSAVNFNLLLINTMIAHSWAIWAAGWHKLLDRSRPLIEEISCPDPRSGGAKRTRSTCCFSRNLSWTPRICCLKWRGFSWPLQRQLMFCNHCCARWRNWRFFLEDVWKTWTPLAKMPGRHASN